jgi:hypothetical protein
VRKDGCSLVLVTDLVAAISVPHGRGWRASLGAARATALGFEEAGRCRSCASIAVMETLGTSCLTGVQDWP